MLPTTSKLCVARLAAAAAAATPTALAAPATLPLWRRTLATAAAAAAAASARGGGSTGSSSGVARRGPASVGLTRGLQQSVASAAAAAGSSGGSVRAPSSPQAAAAAGGGQQAAPAAQPSQQQQQQQQPLDVGVLETMRQLESSIGPLSTQPMAPPATPRVFVISGPSGVGKDAVLKRLQAARPDLHFVVTATSRAMRPGEVEGVDYFFVTKQQFEAWVAEPGALLEHALVYGEYKGIPRGQVDAALGRGADVVLRIDVQGAATVRRLLPGVVSVFLVAESEAQLVGRLVARKTEPLDKMLTRVATAREECRRLADFDYVVVNRDGQLEATVAQLGAIIDSERLRSGGRPQGQQQQPGDGQPLPQ